MANRRMISSDIWRDEFIGTLDLFGRCMWIGIIVTTADDQGRLLNNPRLIRSDIFPLDDPPISQIENNIDIFVATGRLFAYEADGKKLLQIVNWWEYQTPSWACASKYPPPPGWIDREKFHTAGNKIAVRNWDSKGGFSTLPSTLPSQLPSELTSPLNKSNVKGNDKDDGESKGNTEETTSSALTEAFTIATNIMPYNLEKWVEADQTLTRAGITPDEIPVVIQKMQSENLTYSGLWSIVKTAMWVHSQRAAGKPIFDNRNGKKKRVLIGPDGQQIEVEE